MLFSITPKNTVFYFLVIANFAGDLKTLGKQRGKEKVA